MPFDQNSRASTGGPAFGYRPALDGVRALAVSAVLLFHAGLAFLPGGFLGVDAFFVLSGFLITSLLLAEHDRSGRIALGAFWARRARRLLPALLVMLIVTVLLGSALLPAVEVRLLRDDALATLGYLANWRMIYRGADYFAQTAAPSPLQHTWSLGIEEQFYLLWPLVVAGLLVWLGTRRARRTMLLLSVLGAGGSALLAGWLYRTDNVNRAYFGTDTRAQALLIGCALGVGLPLYTHWRAAGGHLPASRHPLLGAAALVGVLGTGYLWARAEGTSSWLYRNGGLACCALAVAAVVAHAVVSPDSPTARVLGLPPLVWLGRISYGVYLWHWPLFQFLNAQHTGLTGVRLLAVRLGVTLAVAAASFYCVEEPIRRGRWLRRLPRRVPLAAGALAIAGTVAVIVVATLPRPLPATPTALPPPRPANAAAAAPKSGTVAPLARPGRYPGAQPRVDIFGDSVAWTIGTYLPDHPGLTVHTRAIEGCGITLLPDILELGTPHRLYPYCPQWPDRWRNAVTADDPDVSVLLVNRWELMDANLNGSYQHVGEPAFDRYLTGQLDEAIGIASARGAQVVLLTAAYTHRAESPSGGLYPEDQPARVDAWNALLRTEATRHPGTVTVYDLNRLVCPDGLYTATVSGLDVRSDGLHFTPAGVQRLIAPWLLPHLATLASTGHS